MHILSMRLLRAQTLASWLLYDSKKRFDRAVSRRITGQSFDALIALNFSAAATFQLPGVEAIGIGRVRSLAGAG
jgi:hypothetical protein